MLPPGRRDHPIVVLSNRGPVSFARGADGTLAGRRGGGGLVSGIAPLVAGTDALWLAAAMSDADRDAAREGVTEADGLRVRLLDIDPSTYRAHYDTICNASLWFAAHGLFDTARTPVLDAAWWEAWDAYREVNAAFAAAAAEVAPEGATVLVQDYHLALVAPALVAARPDVRCAFFAHTPWCEPEGLLPLAGAAPELLAGMAANHAVGFHSPRWADAFRRCTDALLPGAPPPATFVAPLGPDPDDIGAVAASAAFASARDALAARVGGRKVLVRVDRMELSKNVLRGFAAYDALLATHPEWREQVVFVALCYPSREGVPAYATYRRDVEAAVAALNERWATPGWEPIVLETDDDFPRSVAALALADAVLVNPVRDGLNLVAKEQALVSERAAVLVLSTEAGAWDELADGAIGVNPFDVRATAEALHEALAMDADERGRRHAAVKAATLARTPADWLADQLAAAAG